MNVDLDDFDDSLLDYDNLDVEESTELLQDTVASMSMQGGDNADSEEEDHDEEDQPSTSSVQSIKIEKGNKKEKKKAKTLKKRKDTSTKFKHLPTSRPIEPILLDEIEGPDNSFYVKELLEDSRTSNMIENLKNAYDIHPVATKKKVSSSTKKKMSNSREKFVLDKEKSSSSSESDDFFDDDDYEDEDYRPHKSTKKSDVSKSKNVCSKKSTKRKDRQSDVTQFPPTFSEAISESEVEDSDFNWTRLAKVGKQDSKADSVVGSDSEGEEDDDSPRKKRGRRPGPNQQKRRLPDELSSLLGQANVYFAQNRTEDALKMCYEVVRQQPKRPEAYDILGSFYEKMGDMEKYLQFTLLAAHLDSECSGERWAFLAQQALDMKHPDQACAAYHQAARAAPTVWEYYEQKMALLSELNKDHPDSLKRKILMTRFMAVKGMIHNKSLSFDDYFEFAKNVFQECYDTKDMSHAILSLRCCLQRAFEDQLILYNELNLYMELTMQKLEYENAAKAAFSFSGIVFNVKKDANVDMEKFDQVGNYLVPKDLPVDILAKAICCLIYVNQYDNAKCLLRFFEENRKSESIIDLFLDIADALTDKFLYDAAESLLTSLLATPNMATAAVWLCYADTLSSLGRLQAACKAYSNVVELAPKHVNARLSLSALQKQLGLSAEALKTLEVTSASDDLLDLDERLLLQKLSLMDEKKDLVAYIKCARQFLAMFFKEAYNPQSFNHLKRLPNNRIETHLKFIVLGAVRNSLWKSLVRKVPDVKDNSEIKHHEVWQVFQRVFNHYMENKNYSELLDMSCYAYCTPLFLYGGIGYVDTIVGYLLFSALKMEKFSIIFYITRYHHIPKNTPAFYNMLGLVCTASADRACFRYMLRQMINHPDNIALSWLVGTCAMNSSLFVYSLAEFSTVLPSLPDDPLLNLSIGICYINLASKKDIVRRHDLCIQGLCFLRKYEKVRGPSQETYYNLGRTMHQIGLLYAAIHYYELALTFDPAIEEKVDEKLSELYDLRPQIAHNLALIYVSSRNIAMARKCMEKYVVI